MKKSIAFLAGLALCTSAASAQEALVKPLHPALSAEARAKLTQMIAELGQGGPKRTMAEERARSEEIQQDIGGRQMARYGVTMTEGEIAGVPVRIFTPKGGAAEGPVLMNVHGGGFVTDSGSITENVPIAALTGYRVVAVRYRLAPEHVFPAQVDDALAVYRALLAERPASRIGVYGTSAGATLEAELMARLKAEKLPLPAALGFFSGTADLTDAGDSMQIFGVPSTFALVTLFAGKSAPGDPMVSPMRGSLADWPPVLCMTSARDMLLSATANLCRKVEKDGGEAHLVLFDGLPHAFWAYIEAPESDEAFETMAAFLKKHVR